MMEFSCDIFSIGKGIFAIGKERKLARQNIRLATLTMMYDLSGISLSDIKYCTFDNIDTYFKTLQKIMDKLNPICENYWNSNVSYISKEKDIWLLEFFNLRNDFATLASNYNHEICTMKELKDFSDYLYDTYYLIINTMDKQYHNVF